MAQAVHGMMVSRGPCAAAVGAAAVQSFAETGTGVGVGKYGRGCMVRGLPLILAARGVHDGSHFRRRVQLQRQPNASRSNARRSPGAVRAMNDDAASSSGPIVYQGTYGPWSVDSADIREVVLYRSGLVTSAVAFVTVASTAFLPDGNPVKSAIQGVYDPLYALGAGGLGLSLLLIHIYVTPIKRALQLLWAVGVLGSVALAVNFAAPADEGLVQFVVDNPAGVWAVGPLFAALTGLAFKEGLCYGKFEAAALFFVVPSVLLGHLSGVLDDKFKLGLLGAWIGIFIVFAARKFSQPIKDDIGDKSVFIFNGLPAAEKERILQEQRAKQMADTSSDQ